MPKGFYVYELVDPRTDAAFYIGKGKGRRAWVHETAERLGRERNALKAEVLGQIRRAGLRPIVRIVEEGLTQEEALRLERGRIVRDHKSLTNISLGERSPMERVRAEARASLAEVKPLCALLRGRASPDKLAVWRRVVTGLSRIAAPA